MSSSTTVAPRPHQVAALADLIRAFAVHDRAQLVMACGTGKTFVARWHAEASGASTVLVMLPSLALVAQTLTEWRRVRGWPFEALVVCSDPSTAAGAAERTETEDDTSGHAVHDVAQDGVQWASVRAQVTTDPAIAARFLTRAAAATATGGPTRPRVIFSTYHSAPVVQAAQASCGVAVDLAVCDEAHRLSGQPREEFRAVLNPRQILARKRLFMTATPRNSAGAQSFSMDDPKTFGPVAHTIGFGEAIGSGLLCDYKVLVIAAREGQRVDDEQYPGTVPAAVLAAADQHGARRMLTFHSRVAKAAGFSQTLDGATSSGGVAVRARHVSGQMPTSRRRAVMQWLVGGDAVAGDVDGPDELRVVSNAKVLSEGVDIPAVDAVTFADERSSVVDVIQAVGRVLRPAPDKRYGTIVVPVTLPADVDDDTELALSRFSLLWTVLRGLRAHDDRFAKEVDLAVRGQVRHIRGGYRPPRLEFVLPDDVDEDALVLRMVQEVGDAWERYRATCEDWAWRHDGRRMTRTATHRDLKIGEWATKQRLAHRRGLLSAERVQALTQIPGWYWDREDASWADTLSVLAALAQARGTVAENERGDSIFAGLYTAGAPRRRLGLWVAEQRQLYRDGILSADHVTALEQLPGWSWEHLPEVDTAMVDALRQFVAFERTADVPAGHEESGLALGDWVREVRRRKLTGTLHPGLEDEIWSATPSQWAKGERLRWQWDKPATQWEIAFSALVQFANREGHAAPVTTHHEELPDTQVGLGQWVALQRHEHHAERLDPQRARRLEALPGWVWRGDVGGTRPAEAPIDLPSHLQHGSSGAFARGCRCQECLEAGRAYERDWLARRRDQQGAAGVNPAAARRHLLDVEAKLGDATGADRSRRPGTGRVLVAAATGVPVGVLRQLAKGTLPAVSAAHDAAIRACTVQAALSHLTASGTRGRAVAPANQRIDAGPTWDLVEDLRERGFSLGWIGRELGYSRALQLDPDRVTRRVADQVRALHEQVGDLVMPDVVDNRQRPRLTQLRAAIRGSVREGVA